MSRGLFWNKVNLQYDDLNFVSLTIMIAKISQLKYALKRFIFTKENYILLMSFFLSRNTRWNIMQATVATRILSQDNFRKIFTPIGVKIVYIQKILKWQIVLLIILDIYFIIKNFSISGWWWNGSILSTKYFRTEFRRATPSKCIISLFKIAFGFEV